MSRLRYVIFNVIETLLRVFPTPCNRGLAKAGNPDRNSPVLLTGNYHLTKIRVLKALESMDVWLLVANSRGINVWCASAGGHFTTHDVISALKTSGIEEVVDHRDVILPQLAATGIEAKLIGEKTGWNVIWGPVYAKDIPAFIKSNFTKTGRMREVDFPLIHRIEMAAAWAFPVSLLLSLIISPFRREAVLPVICLAWGLSFLIFISFPLYSGLLASRGKGIGFIFFDFGRGGFQLILWGLFMTALIVYGMAAGDLNWGYVARWGFLSFVVVLILSIDLLGSTPVSKSGLHEERLLRVVLDEKRCKGVGLCEEVCPRNCFEVDKKRQTATIPGAKRCVQCGACIIQCPCDALCFESPDGKTISHETVRRFKLNLLGKRFVRAGKNDL